MKKNNPGLLGQAGVDITEAKTKDTISLITKLYSEKQ